MTNKFKAALAALVVVAVAGIYGGVHYHDAAVRSTPPVATRQVRHRVSYVNPTANGRRIGRLALIKNRRRAPKLKLAKSIVAMDAKTGQIVYQRNPNQPRKVASVAKLMTLYLVEQKVARVPNGWNRVVSATNQPRLRKMSYDKKLGGFKFKKGHRYTVKDLFQAALIQSSNNSAIALGEWVAGSNRNFVKLMNAQARAWHLNAHFVSASGLENDDLKPYGLKIAGNATAGNLISAKSVAIIAQHLITQHAGILKTSRRDSAEVAGQHLNNLNNLLPGKGFAKPGIRVDGLKTGFTPDAGYCYVGTEQPRHKDRLITVVLHDADEFTDTRSLMKFINANSRA